MLIGRIELTVGRDLQYIRFNGSHDRRAGRFGLARAGAGVEAHPLTDKEVRMAQAPQSFTDMFKNLGEQLKLPRST